MGALISTAEIAALMGDPARANMLWTLLDSDTATAGELTVAANVAPSTASEHLAKMIDAKLIAVTKVGRKRYFRLTSDRVGDVLRGLEVLASDVHPDGPLALREDEAMLHARGCCDHLAGRVGVMLTESLIGRGHVTHRNGTLSISDEGSAFLTNIGADVPELLNGPRRLITLCHDWSVDAFHMGGALGGTLLQIFYERDWLRRRRGEHSVRITPLGRAGFRETFDIDLRGIG